jgi:hypothetical protein
LEVTKYYPADKAMINVIKGTKGTVAIKITLLLIMEEYYKYNGKVFTMLQLLPLHIT